MRSLIPGCLALAAVAAACAGQAGPDHAQSVLISSPPPGYAANGRASGPLAGVMPAAQLMPTGLTSASAALTADHFAGGYVQVFTKGQDFLTVIGLDFDSGGHAQAFQDFVIAQLKASGTVYTISDPQIPGSRLYTAVAPTRSGVTPVFCDGVWFTSGATGVDSVTCSPTPGYPDLAEQIAAVQYRQTGGMLTSATPPA